MHAPSKSQEPLLKQINVRSLQVPLFLQSGATEFCKRKDYHIWLQKNEDFWKEERLHCLRSLLLSPFPSFWPAD